MVIFLGGSWGVGEWDFEKISGPSVVNYFSEHDTTLNLCKSSIGSIEQLNKLKSFLDRYKYNHSDVIYWLVHNPLVNVPVEKIYTNHASLHDSVMSLLLEQLAEANEYAQKNDLLINLVGASCDLDEVDISQFNKLNIRLSSWGKLLAEDYPVSIFSHQMEHLPNLKKELEIHRPDLLEEYYKISSISFGKRRCMLKNKEMFRSFHPTALGHLKLQTYLCSEEAWPEYKRK